MGFALAAHLHGYPGVPDDWEGHPALAEVARRLEEVVETDLRARTAALIAMLPAGTPYDDPAGAT